MDAEHQRLVALGGAEASRLLALPPALQQAVLRQLELHAARRVARDLVRMLQARWWPALPPDDQIRAARVVAHVSARAGGMPHEEPEPCARTILDNTLDSILPPHGSLELRFDDLPRHEGVLVAGLCRPPHTVVLSRGAIASSDARLGDGDPLELRVGLATLVHEVNHLHNLTPVGPTYEAFADEYRAWWVDFVAHVGRWPRRLEALARCQELLGSPAYAELGQALHDGSEHGARIVDFMRGFGPVARPCDVRGMQAQDELGPAPLPRPRGNLDNAPPAASRGQPRGDDEPEPEPEPVRAAPDPEPA